MCCRCATSLCDLDLTFYLAVVTLTYKMLPRAYLSNCKVVVKTANRIVGFYSIYINLKRNPVTKVQEPVPENVTYFTSSIQNIAQKRLNILYKWLFSRVLKFANVHCRPALREFIFAVKYIQLSPKTQIKILRGLLLV